jgi:choice-of-anchor C domain-containing protein
MRTKYLGVAAFLAVFAVVSPVSANVIVNGGFEDPQIDTFFVNFGSGLPDWNVFVNNVDIVLQGKIGASAAFEGKQYLDLVGYGSTGGIEQSFATQIGKTYSLTFAYANNAFGGPTNDTAEVDVFGASQLLTDFVNHSSSTTADLNWTIYTKTFVANSTSTRLSFNETVGGGNAGVLLDAISVSAVPELATWAMMLIGFAGLGFVAYRRTKKISAAAAI